MGVNLMSEVACKSRLYVILDELVKEEFNGRVEIEYPIKFDKGPSKRVDLVVFIRNRPLLVIEVKSVKVGGTFERAISQAYEYAKLLRSNYLAVTDCRSLLIFKYSEPYPKILRSYYRLDNSLISKEFWYSILNALIISPSTLPKSDSLTKENERALLGVARHIAWKILCSKRIPVPLPELNKLTSKIYRGWINELKKV